MLGKAKAEGVAREYEHVRSVETETASWARVTQRELLPGDLLFSVRTDPTSTLIRTVAHGRYSHVGLWTGNGVIEALTIGVKERSLAESLKGTSYCHAFRSRYLDESEPIRATIVNEAMKYEGCKYSWAHLTLLTVSTLGALHAGETPKQQMLVLEIVNKVLQYYREKHPVAPEHEQFLTCASLVASAYYNAGVPLIVDPEPRTRLSAPFSTIAKGIVGMAQLARKAFLRAMWLKVRFSGYKHWQPGVPGGTMYYPSDARPIGPETYMLQPILATPEMLQTDQRFDPIGVVTV